MKECVAVSVGWVLMITAMAAGQTTVPATQPSGMSDADLLALCRTEASPLFKSADADTCIAAHALIEQFFAAKTQKERVALTQQLEATKLNANVLGRLCRVRRGWTAMQPGVYFINETVGSFEVKYFLGVPQGYNRSFAAPLVITLPTADAFLTNPPPDNLGVTKIYTDWMKQEIDRHRDAIVVMPLLNLDELYGPSKIGMNNVMQAMHHATEVMNIDSKRVYVMGHSMGGHATWNLALHYPTYFAAIAPLAGSATADWQRLRLMNLSNLLPVVWQDSSDEITLPDPTRQLVRALRQMKIDVTYIETKNVGHVPPPSVIGQVCEAMRARSRELYPKEVLIQTNKPETAFNRVDWVQIYQPIRPGPEQRMRIAHGTGPMVVNQNTCNVRAMLNGNKVTAMSDNVMLVRFYFNDQMIDFSQAVAISVNGKNRYEGFLTPSVDEMLKDQLFTGRGWRYFTAVVDLDLTQSGTTQPTTRK